MQTYGLFKGSYLSLLQTTEINGQLQLHTERFPGDADDPVSVLW